MEIETKTTTTTTTERSGGGSLSTSDGSSDGSSSFVTAALIGVLLFLACAEHGRRAHLSPHPRGHITSPVRR
jgi:hypothetical protein